MPRKRATELVLFNVLLIQVQDTLSLEVFLIWNRADIITLYLYAIFVIILVEKKIQFKQRRLLFKFWTKIQ